MHKLHLKKEKSKVISEVKALEAQVILLLQNTEPEAEIPEDVDNTVTLLLWATGIPG